jgi:hypothetical protein
VRLSQRNILGAISSLAVMALCLAPGAISSLGLIGVWSMVLLAVGPVIYLLIHLWITHSDRHHVWGRRPTEGGPHGEH